jgi:hypothetical protein
MVSKTGYTIDLHLSILDPIEIEMERWLRYMELSWRTQASTTIWRKQVRECEAYANAYKTAREHLQKELNMFPVSERRKTAPITKKEGLE